MFRSLRRRLAAWYLAILGLVLAVYGAGTFVLACQVLAHGADQANRHLLAPVEAAFARGGHTLPTASTALAEGELTEGEHVELLDAGGKVLLARGLALPPLPVTVGSQTEHGPRALQVRTVTLERGGVVVGYARAAHSLTLANRALAGLGLALLLVVPLALLAAWLGGNWLAAKAVRPVEAAWERERQFTRDAAHELRTPLAVMQAHAELAAQLPGDAALRNKLTVLQDTTRKMSRLVGDLLTLSREDAGVGGQALTFAFDELLEDELEALAPLAVARGVTLEVAPLPEGQLVRGDPGRLGQTVRNVLDNALRYAGASGQVSVCLRRADGHLALVVGNTGPAIPAADRDAIFERFYRADAGRQANPEGGGLGLPISRAIARAHGGELALTSAAGEATVFTLRLPLLA